ncbi:MAG TPA: nucleotidyl transferase AbiEii/AbiGii toxin family protein [Bacteroides sp.]|nr:nucleotidyl transferase AbiEii/AbiGii toxin family protein [Bacteroides sp.]
MPSKLKWQTVSATLAEVLTNLMALKELSAFRLVEGTSLSLQLGHRESDDIDLFTDQVYGSVDFKDIDGLLRNNFEYVSKDLTEDFSWGIMRLVGTSEEECIKLDMFYTDPFIRKPTLEDGIRMASVEDIAAMKMEVISSGGRKRDFWDIDELLELYELGDLLNLYLERNPYMDIKDALNGLTDFDRADQEDDPVCLLGKFWDLIKLDIIEVVEEYRTSR